MISEKPLALRPPPWYSYPQERGMEDHMPLQTSSESQERWQKVLRERRAAEERDDSWLRGADAYRSGNEELAAE